MLKRVRWRIFTFLGGIFVGGSPYLGERAPNTTQVVMWLLFELLLYDFVLGGNVLQDALGEPVVEPLGMGVLVTDMLERGSPLVQRPDQLNHVVHPPLHTPHVQVSRLAIPRRYRSNIVAPTHYARL